MKKITDCLIKSVAAMCGLILLLFILLKAFVARDIQPTQINTTYNQLRHVQANIEQIIYTNGDLKTILSVEEIEKAYVSKHSEKTLYSEIAPKLKLVFNPDMSKWVSTNHVDDVAIISPYQFTDKSSSSYFYIGINFSGERTNLSSPPSWANVESGHRP